MTVKVKSSRGSYQERTCQYCGEKFQPTRKDANCCGSDTCRLKRHIEYCHKYLDKNKKPAPVLTCKICGNSFTRMYNNQIYCSSECQKEAKRQRERVILVNCVVCNKVFKRTKNQKFCSDKCREVAQGKTFRKQHLKNPKGLPDRVCDICGKTYTPKRANSKRCSDECRTEALRQYRTANYKPKERGRYKTKPAHYNLAIKRKKRTEKVLVEDMPILNKNVKNDAEKIKKAGIVSPDHTTMEFKHYDPTLRIIRYFKTEEKYNNYLKTLEKETV